MARNHIKEQYNKIATQSNQNQ